MSNAKKKRKLRRRCIRRQGGRCYYCGVGVSEMRGTATLDHVVPLSKGGATALSNSVVACAPCNRAKADRLPNHA